MEQPRTLTVICGMQGGVVLRTYETRTVEGLPHAVPDRTQIELRYGENPGVDADQFAKWLDANKDGDIVLKGLVYAAPEVPEEALKPLVPPPVSVPSETDVPVASDETGLEEPDEQGVQAEFTASEERA